METLEGLFDAMAAAGVGRPKDEKDLSSYRGWSPIYRAFLREGVAYAIKQIAYVAKAMGVNRRLNHARNEAMVARGHSDRSSAQHLADALGYERD